MNTIEDIISNLYRTLRFSRLLIWHARIFLVALLSPKARLAARLLAAESQLAIYNHRISQKKKPKPRFNPAFRLLWSLFSRCWTGWRSAAHLMQPATVSKWHRQGLRLYWRWKSRKRGRPKFDLTGLSGFYQHLHYSRRVIGFAVFKKKPTSLEIRSFLGKAFKKAGKIPRHIIMDKESIFFCVAFKKWCRRKKILTRYGAVGKFGSVSAIELKRVA